MFEIVFSFYVKDNNIFLCLHNIRLSVTYRNASVLCQSECACLHQTVNTVVFFVKKGEHSCKCTELSLLWKERIIGISLGKCLRDHIMFMLKITSKEKDNFLFNWFHHSSPTFVYWRQPRQPLYWLVLYPEYKLCQKTCEKLLHDVQKRSTFFIFPSWWFKDNLNESNVELLL